MSHHIHAHIENAIGHLVLDRPQALNSLSLDMIRELTHHLLAWRDSDAVRAVCIRSSHERALCAGGDIRFFYSVGTQTPRQGSALLEDFFSEEYALNHLIRFYPKPYFAIMDGIVMGGGMGIAQSAPSNALRIVTERTKMAMPEVNIGLFPDVGGGYFLAHTPGQLGTYLGLTGETILAADALYAGLADHYLPSTELENFLNFLRQTQARDLHAAVREFATKFTAQCDPAYSQLALHRQTIERIFAAESMPEIMHNLRSDHSAFAEKTLAIMATRSPLMMCVTLAQLRKSATLSVSACLRLERDMVRHSFAHGEVLEGVRALVIAKDNAPQWAHANVEEVPQSLVDSFLISPWPAHAHPLRHLQG